MEGLKGWWPPTATQVNRYGLPLVGGIFLPLSATSFGWAIIQARDARQKCVQLQYKRAAERRTGKDETKKKDAGPAPWEVDDLREFEEAQADLKDLMKEAADGVIMGHTSILRLTDTLRIARRFRKKSAKCVVDRGELDALLAAGNKLAIEKLALAIPAALHQTMDSSNIQYRTGARVERLLSCFSELLPDASWWQRSKLTSVDGMDEDGTRLIRSSVDDVKKAYLRWQKSQRLLRRRQVLDLLWEGRAQLGLAVLATGLSVVRGILDPVCSRFEADIALATFSQDSNQLWISARATLFTYLIRASLSHMIEISKTVGLETFKDHVKGRLFRSILSQDIEWFDTQDIASLFITMNTVDFNFSQLLMLPARGAELLASVGIGAFALLKTDDKHWNNMRLMLTLWLLGKAPMVVHMIGLVLPTIVESCIIDQQMRQQASHRQEVMNPRTFRTIRAFTHEPEELRRNEASIAAERKMKLHANIANIFLQPLQQLAEVGMRLYSMWWSRKVVVQGRLAEGESFSLSAYADRSVESLLTLVPAIVNLWNLDHFYRAVDVICMVPKIGLEGGDIPAAGSVNFDIEFQNVSFSYPSRPEALVLKGCSFCVKEGTCVGLMGESGAGKSTCLGLLERFYDVTKGEVLLGGRDVREYNPLWLRDQMAIVTQEPVLLNGTIRGNLAYGCKESVPDATLWEACELANISAVLQDKQRFPEGLRTAVGPGGVQLSGGEKQRIAIARAVLRDPKILLLDEATSALDYENEELVQLALDKLMKGRTTLIIAHRLSTMRKADKIVCMTNGEVVEEGTHETLMANGQLYARLIDKQSQAVMQQGGFKKLELKQRLVDVKVAFQSQDPSADELLNILLEDLQRMSGMSKVVSFGGDVKLPTQVQSSQEQVAPSSMFSTFASLR